MWFQRGCWKKDEGEMGVKSITEYAIYRWLKNADFQTECFDIKIHGNDAILTDRNGDTMHLRYDGRTREVVVCEN